MNTTTATTEKEQHKAELAKARYIKFYAANKERVAEQRKARRAKVNTDLAAFRELNKVDSAVNTVIPNQLLLPEILRTIKEDNTIITGKRMRDSAVYSTRCLFRAITPSTNIYPYITETPELLIDKIKSLKQQSGDEYTPATLPKLLANLLTIIKLMKLAVTDETDKLFYNSYRIAKLRCSLELYHNKHPLLNESTTVKNYDTVLRDILAKYGESGLVYLVAKLYEEAPLRNDYSNIILISNSDEAKFKTKNYLVLPITEGTAASIIINKHKTKRTRGVINYTFSSSVSDLLRNYINTHKINYGSNLFGNLTTELHIISNENNTRATEQGTRLIRRMVASTLYDKYITNQATADDVFNQIKLMAHTENVHINSYIYGVRY